MSSIGGLFKWLVGTLVVVLVGMFIINRIPFLKSLVG